MQNRNEQRSANQPLPAGMAQNNFYNPATGAQATYVPGQFSTAHGNVKDFQYNSGIVEHLGNALGGLGFGAYGSAGTTRSQHNAVNSNINAVGMAANQAAAPVYYQLSDGRLYMANGVTQGAYAPGSAGFNVGQQGQFVPHNTYLMNQAIPGTPNASSFNNQHYGRDVPDLAAPRRNSFSSNEEGGPHTPFFGAQAPADFHTRVAVNNTSPLAWTAGTPSPINALDSHNFYPQQLVKTATGYSHADLDALCMKHPAIPTPIPAIFSGEKGRGTLEKSLVNLTNTTNVYIRGLRPDTTDEMLHAYGARFGEIQSAKSMLDQATGHCKGFGFIKYHNHEDGESCIRAFFHWGYEAKWARVSHNEKLKNLSEPENTNLYISNLPLSYNEHELMAIFIDDECLSAKILRDPNGVSRGVGFARFATPEICHRIIEHYNGHAVSAESGEKYTLSIRFADTPEQKKLKTETAARRQYKATEYNAAAYCPGSPYQSPNAPQFVMPLSGRSPNIGTLWPHQSPLANTYASVGGIAAPYGLVNKFSGENTDIAPRGNASVKIVSPTDDKAKTNILGARTNSNVKATSPKKVDTSENGDAPKAASVSGSKSSPAKSSVSSPSKLSPSKAMGRGSNILKAAA